MKNKVVFIVGPTGVGKTNLALSLATKLDGGLVSADSIQVYKGLDIVSGKDLPKTAQYISLPQYNNGDNTGFYIDRGVPIFLLDVVEPSFPFSVSSFCDLATNAITYIRSQNKTPVVVGGTGLYVNSLLNPIDTLNVKPNLKFRKKLEKINVFELQKLLPEEKLRNINESDKNNPRRLIRAIEVLELESIVKSQVPENIHKFDALIIGLTCDRETLKERINKRVDTRFEQGALEEATRLFTRYEKLAPQIKDANGYKQLFQYLKKEITLEESIYRWKISEYHHAKNQMTWFQKYGNVEWFDINKSGLELDIERRVKNFQSKIISSLRGEK